MYEGKTEIRYPSAMAVRAFQLLVNEAHKVGRAPTVTKVEYMNNLGGGNRFAVTVEQSEEDDDGE